MKQQRIRPSPQAALVSGKVSLDRKRRRAAWEMELAEVLEGDLGTAASRTPVGQIMSRNVVCVPAGMSVESVTDLLLERGISGAPVVDRNRRLCGMVTMTDLMRERHDSAELVDEVPARVHRLGVEADLGESFHSTELARATAAEVMRPVVVALSAHAPIIQAVALMSAEGVPRIPVIGDDERVVGILSALDLLRWWAQQDGSTLAVGVQIDRHLRHLS